MKFDENFLRALVARAWLLGLLLPALIAAAVGADGSDSNGLDSSRLKSIGDRINVGLVPNRIGTESFNVPEPTKLKDEPNKNETGEGEKEEESKSGHEWFVVPVPSYQPLFGWTMAVPVGVVYKPKFAGPDAPSWITAAAGAYTQNKSWAVGAAHKMNLGNDRWRFLAAAGLGQVNYDFYRSDDSGSSIPINQEFTGGLVDVLYAPVDNFFFGVRLGGANTAGRLARPDEDSPPDDLPDRDIGVSMRLIAISPKILYDTRDSQFYPGKGIYFDTGTSIYNEAWGSDRNFETYHVYYNQYFTVGKSQILAIRGAWKGVSGDVPFFMYPTLGSGVDLRGYTPMVIRGRILLAGQMEYRVQFAKRWVAVAFAGLGSVAESISEIDTSYPSAGFGIRFFVNPKSKMALRADIAWGKDERLFYLAIGESF